MITYKITNITIKPVRIDKKTGKDTRTASECFGSRVSFYDYRGAQKILDPRGAPFYTQQLNDQIYRLQDRGVVSVEELKDGGLGELNPHAQRNKIVEENAKIQEKVSQELFLQKDKESESNENAKRTERVKVNMLGKLPEEDIDAEGVDPDNLEKTTITAKTKGEQKENKNFVVKAASKVKI